MGQAFPEGPVRRVATYTPLTSRSSEYRKRTPTQSFGTIRLSVYFREAPIPEVIDPAHAANVDPLAVEEQGLSYLQQGGLEELVAELEDSLPAGVEVGSIDVYEGSIELIVLLVAAYKTIRTFDEVVETLASATETLRRILRRLLGTPGVAVWIRARFVPDLAFGGPGGGRSVALLPPLRTRTILLGVGLFLGAITFLSLLAVLVAYLLSRF